jgi:hypothetical protein
VPLSPSSVSVTESNPVNQTLTPAVGSSADPGTYALQIQATSGGLTWQATPSLMASAPGGGGSGSGRGRAGTTWTLRVPGSNDLHGVTYGNGRFVAVGSGGTILTSPDGVKWTRRTSGTNNLLYGVTYGNGLFVAVGDRGTILTSP